MRGARRFAARAQQQHPRDAVVGSDAVVLVCTNSISKQFSTRMRRFAARAQQQHPVMRGISVAVEQAV